MQRGFFAVFLVSALMSLASIWLYNRFSGKSIADLGKS
jgi:hypothetical protein